MSDETEAPEALDWLDDGWDELVDGTSREGSGLDAGDLAVVSALTAINPVSPPTARRIWMMANAARAVSPGIAASRDGAWRGRNAVVASAGPGWWPVGLVAGVIALATAGGVLIGDDGERGGSFTLPGDASSVVATRAPSAPAFGTPGGELWTSPVSGEDENG